MTTLMLKKYDFKEIETKWRTRWQKDELYKFIENSDKPLYVVDTPPPYVSADHLHAGHIMSYAQAEFIVRYKRMRGYNVYYPMGFDDNGLPTERFVEKKYNVDKSNISRSEFIKLCLEETKKGSKTYKELWDSLGVSVDWSKTYSTIGEEATKVSQWSVIDLYNKGALYRDDQPILWCVHCKTALAQADLEDEEMEGFLNHIEFEKGLVIATTRPELLPACVALYVNPTDSRYKKYLGKEVKVPLFDYKVPVMPSEKVDKSYGTGLMMVCTFGDAEDVEKWKNDKLQTRAVLTEDGKLNKLAGVYAKLTIKEARSAILESLKKSKQLLKQETLKHSVNVHERCGTPIEFILSKQWFIKLVENKNEWLKYGNQLNWFPKNRQKDYEVWVENLKWDWCISRQRFFGVPIPVWYCEDCDHSIFARPDDLPVNPIEDKPPVSQCPKCNCKKLKPEEDVLDTWATSSVTPLIIKELVDEKHNSNLYPATLRPNAFEIIRTWDFYTVVKSHYHFNALPFKDVMISGHGHDDSGRKFSKRLNNYVPSHELVEKHGADAIRYWATGAQLGKNLRFSESEIEMGNKTAVKIFNVAKLINMHLDKLENKSPQLEAADVWVLNKLNETISQTTGAFEAYAYSKAKDSIENFFWNTLTDYYIEFIKYRLFGDNKDSSAAAIHTLHRVFLATIKIYAPLIPYITEEVYQGLYSKNESSKSIHLSSWPATTNVETELDISDFNQAIEAINEIRKYKSEQGISLGKELDFYKLKTKVDLTKYGEFISKAIRVTKLNT